MIMLEELSKFENLGTPRFYIELLKSLEENSRLDWNSIDIANHFKNRVIEGRSNFDGCTPLLILINILTTTKSGYLELDSCIREHINNIPRLSDEIVARTIHTLRQDPTFLSFFSTKHLSHDPIYKSIKIKNGAFPLKHSSFKQFLIDFNFLEPIQQSGSDHYLINNRYRSIFEKEIVSSIKRHKIGMEELKAILKIKAVIGEEAEKFVLEFEKIRLPHLKDKIDWVATYSVSDGYDIASFESDQSKRHDRFIEVKSYKGSPYFYWSRNEMNIAKIRGNQYYLYLVNRNDVNLTDYTPLIIRNPYETITEEKDGWVQRIENIKFSLKKSYVTLKTNHD